MLTRRKFGTTLVAGVALATSAQQARPQPAGKRTIVDAQVHFWKANSPDWPWDPSSSPSTTHSGATGDFLVACELSRIGGVACGALCLCKLAIG